MTKLDDQVILDIEHYASIGSTLEDIAMMVGIGVRDFYQKIALGQYVDQRLQENESIQECATNARVSEIDALAARSIYHALERGSSAGRVRTLESLSVLAKGKAPDEPVPTILPNLQAIKLQLQLQGRLEYRNRIEDQKSELEAHRVVTPRLDANSLRTKANLLLSGDATNVLPNDTLTAMDSSVGSNGDSDE